MIHPSTERALNPYASSTTKKPTGMSRISLPSYDTGIDRVPEDQIALIHEGEKVVPADENPDNGAPSDFSGRVIPNPRGIQPILDTDIERLRPADTDHLSRGAKANINNAPLVNPNGDVSNPPATEVIPAQGRLISTADQSKAKARDTVDNPGAQTTASTAPDELIQDRDMKEQPTKGGLLADQYLKHIGLPAITRPNPEPTPTAGYQPIKTAASAVVPKETLQLIPGTPENREYHQDTAGGTLIPGAPSTYDKATTRDFAQMRYKAKLADYDKRIQDARDAATPEGQEQADRLTLAKLSFQKANPWGSEGNHPGILGKIGHVAEIVASRAPGIAPIMATLPESEIGRTVQTSTAQGNLEKDTQLATQRAAEENKPTTSKEWQEISGGAIDPKHPELGPQPAFYNKNNPDEGIKFGNVPLAPKAGAEKTSPANESQIADYKSRIANSGLKGKALDVYGSVPAGSTSAELDKRFEEATKLRGMDQKDQENMIQNQMRLDAAKEHKEEHYAGKTFVFSEPDGTRRAMTYEQAQAEGRNPADATIYNAGDAEKLRKQNNSYQSATSAFDTYQKDLENAKLSSKDYAALGALTAHDDSHASGFAMGLANEVGAGTVDLLLGKPFTGYTQKLMQSYLNKEQYDNLSPAGQKVLADYYTAMLAHFSNMKAQQGSIPRNPMMIQTEMQAIPLPYLSADQARPKFDNYRARLDEQNEGNVKFGNTQQSKEKPSVSPAQHQQLLQSITMPEGGHPADVAQGPDGTIVWSGKAGDPWIDLNTGRAIK